MRLRIRLAAIASALALTGGLTLTFAGPASAASGFHITNVADQDRVVGRGVSQSVQLSSSQADTFEADGSTSVLGHTWYRYEDTNFPGDCLQANVADTTVTLGGCASSDRQYWYWPETNGEGPLENLASGTYAYSDGTAMNLRTEISGNASLWEEPSA